MPIIDYHAHLRRDYATKRYFTEELLGDSEACRIDVRLVSTQEGSSIADQNRVVGELASQHPDKLLAAAVINPKADDALDEMERIAASGSFVAIEFDSLEHGYIPEIAPNIDEIFHICAEHGLVVNCFTGWGDHTAPMQWAYYAKRHPGVPVVMLHMGGYDYGYNCIEVARRFDNVFVETSDVYELPIMHIALEKIPHRKILFGSQYPDKITQCSIDFFDMFDITEQDRELFFWKNAARLLKLDEARF